MQKKIRPLFPQFYNSMASNVYICQNFLRNDYINLVNIPGCQQLCHWNHWEKDSLQTSVHIFIEVEAHIYSVFFQR